MKNACLRLQELRDAGGCSLPELHGIPRGTCNKDKLLKRLGMTCGRARCGDNPRFAGKKCRRKEGAWPPLPPLAAPQVASPPLGQRARKRPKHLGRQTASGQKEAQTTGRQRRVTEWKRNSAVRDLKAHFQSKKQQQQPASSAPPTTPTAKAARQRGVKTAKSQSEQGQEEEKDGEDDDAAALEEAAGLSLAEITIQS